MVIRSRGRVLLFVAPFVLGVLWLLGPVITGGETLFLRDVFNTHLEMKTFQAEAMRSGSLPLIDTLRSGGQPHLGNPNTVPLYPDNLLYLVATPIWALNAHFWLHLLLAPVAFFYLARQWGLGREASWASGVIYATGGFYLSTLSLYNLTAGVTLAPAFVGTCLALARGRAAGRTWVAASLLWTLLVLGGDPMTAVMALAAALAAVGFAHGWRLARWSSIVWAVVLGSLVAAPQIVEFLLILPASYRGVQGYSVSAASAASWGPANILEWFIPMAFGEPTLLYWGERFHAGRMPLLHSFYPGLIAVAAMIAGLRRGEKRFRWTVAMIAVGVFLAMGSYNPVTAWLMGLPGMSLLRLPAKLWLLVAMGSALLAGVGFDRLMAGEATERLRRTLWALAIGMTVVAIALWTGSGVVAETIGGWMPRRIPPEFAAQEAGRWARSSVVTAVLLWVAALACSRARLPRPVLVGGLLTLHVVGQVVLLAPLVPTDSIGPYRQTSPLLQHIPPEARVVHGDARGLFGPEGVALSDLEGIELKWLQRDTAARLYPPIGMLHGRRYEFWLSPEGLDSFLGRRVAEALELVDDPRRLSLLEASGVTHLLLGRELEGIDADRVEMLATIELRGGPLHLYRLRHSALEVELVGRVLRAVDARSAVAQLMDPTFDPRRAAVLAGEGPPLFGGGGEVEVVESDAESLHLRVRSRGPGAVVVQRSYLPIYTAELDGEPVDVSVANMHRMAIEVPGGEHDVQLRVDRRGFLPALLVSLLGLLLIGLQARRASAASDPAAG